MQSHADLLIMAALQQLMGRSPRPSTSHQARPFTAKQRPIARWHHHQLIARAGDGETPNVPGTLGQGKVGISEDVLERLRKAEAEAASLRAQLKASRPVVEQVG